MYGSMFLFVKDGCLCSEEGSQVLSCLVMQVECDHLLSGAGFPKGTRSNLETLLSWVFS